MNRVAVVQHSPALQDREASLRIAAGHVDEAAQHHGVTIACGINERDTDASGGTIYNAMAIIGPDVLHLTVDRHRRTSIEFELPSPH